MAEGIYFSVVQGARASALMFHACFARRRLNQFFRPLRLTLLHPHPCISVAFEEVGRNSFVIVLTPCLALGPANRLLCQQHTSFVSLSKDVDIGFRLAFSKNFQSESG
ncbi:unnamed protein product [Protopolystoma xenopodis]|uniref:Uncharacterized protein n=1 Tax=Protopolystoma xenopodis TaxID=117903 RepID=A0A3S4ZV61_9PLAT|nr:unnamed protein product [Protopolystoma xenopodis]